ncbi:hypothetical protein BGZ94_003552 [Podila epigama]|nr:hypothetical protein BGZ94_003552 [Podila epigama]
MTPEELATLFKRRGDFDDTRKKLLNDFQSSTVGQQFTHQLGDILQSSIDEDPSLLERDRSDFHQIMLERITKSAEYKKVQQFVDSLLQPTQYLKKIESTLLTIVQEQAPQGKRHRSEASSVLFWNTNTKALYFDHRVDKESAQKKEKGKEESSSTSSSGKRNHQGDSKHEKSRKSDGPERSKGIDKPLRSVSSQEAATNENRKEDKNKHDTESLQTSNGSSDSLDRDSMSSLKKESSPPPEPLPSSSPSSSHPLPLRKKGSRLSGSMHITPKKRTRRQSADSNSSLSSPPSSSEPESDAEGPIGEGARAKKVIKKANKDQDSVAKLDMNALGNSSIESMDIVSDRSPKARMDIDVPGSVKTGSEETVDIDMKESKSTEDNEEQQSSLSKSVGSVQKQDENRSESSLEAQVSKSEAQSDQQPSKDSPQGGTSVAQEPAATAKEEKDSGRSISSTNGNSLHGRRESEPERGRERERERERSRPSSGSAPHRLPGPPLKRTHTPQPLPPRPNIVPLPPKPNVKPGASLSRRTSHSRTSSAAVVTTATTGSPSASVVGSSSVRSGSPHSPSSGVSSTLSGSTSSPSLPTTSSSSTSGPSSRHHSFSGRGGESSTHGGGHTHIVHSLPPPPHQLQHPLPPTPRLPTSRSTPHSLNTKSGSAHGHSSISPSVATSSNSTPTTPRSANLTSPDSIKSPHETLHDQDRAKEKESAKENPLAPSLLPGKTDENGQLKSPDSNSSNDSLSSTGSLSTTGSVSGTLDLSPSTRKEGASTPGEKSSDDGTAISEKHRSEETGSMTSSKPQPAASSTSSTPPPPPVTDGSEGSNASGNDMKSPSAPSPKSASTAQATEESVSSDNKASHGRPSSTGSSESHNSHSGGSKPVPQLHPSKSSQGGSVPSPTGGNTLPVSKSHHHQSSSSSHTQSLSTGTSGSASSGFKAVSRRPIPLPHKPIPLPPKPTSRK